MKKITTVIVLLLAVIAMYGQDIVGTWNGSLTVKTMDGDYTLRIVFHITATDNGFSSTFDSPDQDSPERNTFGLATDTTTYENKELSIRVSGIDFVYNGKLVDAKNIKGSFTQKGVTNELDLIKKEE